MPTPNFHDLPDGSSSIHHTEEDYWTEIFDGDEMLIPGPNPVPPQPPQTATEVNEARRRVNPEWRTIPPATPEEVRPAVPVSQNSVGYSSDFPPPFSPPRRSTRRFNRRVSSDPDAAIRKDPNAWSLREAVELCKLLEVVLPEAGFHIALTGPLLYLDGKRKECHLMFYQIRGTEPNYEILWKYLTVAGVIRSPSYPENGWLVKATYRGKAVDCLFPNAKKAKKAGTAKEDCYKAAPAPPPVTGQLLSDLERYLADLPTPSLNSTALCGPETTQAILEAAREQDRESERRTGIVDPTSEARARMTAEGYVINPAWAPGESVLVRHNDGIPILYRRSPSAPSPYDPAELLATPAPAPVPPRPQDFSSGIDRSFAAQRAIRAERQAEAIVPCQTCGLHICPGC